MALAARTIWDCRIGGADTNGGGFDPTNANFSATLSATSGNTASPVVSSSAYTFVAGDVGHWLFIQSGTNWLPGWYQIASVSAGAATLGAGIGQGVTYLNQRPWAATTVAGVASVASPTTGRFGVDYSQQSTGLSITGMANGATTTQITSVTSTGDAAIGVNWIGNVLNVTTAGGTAWTLQRYQITNVSGGIATIDKSGGGTSRAGGAGTLGGYLATPATPGAVVVAGNILFLQYNTSPYLQTSVTTNVSGGSPSFASGALIWGWNTSRFFSAIDSSRPTIQISSLSSATMIIGTTAVFNVILDANSQTTSKISTGASFYFNCILKNATAASSGGNNCLYCYATGNSGTIFTGECNYCEASANTGTTFVGGPFSNCISRNNTGASTDAFLLAAGGGEQFLNNAAYGCSRHGFTIQVSNAILVNCVSESNGSIGYNIATTGVMTMINCADYNNTSGRFAASPAIIDINPITGSSSFFVNAASGNFALNNTAGAGALLRAAGFPSVFPAGLTNTYEDIGAAQHQDSGGSGGVSGSRIFSGF